MPLKDDTPLDNTPLSKWISSGRNKTVRAGREQIVEDMLSLVGEVYIENPKDSPAIQHIMSAIPAIDESDAVHATECEYMLKKPSLPEYVNLDETSRLERISTLMLKDKAVHHYENLFAKKLHKWFDRTVISGKAKRNLLRTLSIFYIKNGATSEMLEDLEYVFDKRTMLASNKTFTETHLEHYLDRIEADKHAGQEAYKIYDAWHRRYSGRYVQTPGQIMPLIKDSLLKGVSVNDCSQALELLGKKSAPVTSNSMQYALMEARELARSKRESGAHGSEVEFDGDKFVDIDDNHNYGSVDSWRHQKND